MLFHVSEDAGISRFEPRPSEYTDDPVVWAIDDERLRNYLLPRDCPRVTCYAGPHTTDDDRKRFLGAANAVVAIEESWLERVRGCVLYCYHLPPDTFVSRDQTAGYYVSRVPVVPAVVRHMGAPLAELTRRAVDVRVLPELWSLHDAVIASTLEFSIIRMRNALPRVAPRATHADSVE
jgi:hypothetical protein